MALHEQLKIIGRSQTYDTYRRMGDDERDSVDTAAVPEQTDWVVRVDSITSRNSDFEACHIVVTVTPRGLQEWFGPLCGSLLASALLFKLPHSNLCARRRYCQGSGLRRNTPSRRSLYTNMSLRDPNSPRSSSSSLWTTLPMAPAPLLARDTG